MTQQTKKADICGMNMTELHVIKNIDCESCPLMFFSTEKAAKEHLKWLAVSFAYAGKIRVTEVK